MMIVVALGNPGEKYENTRHNAGWIIFDELGLDWQINKYAESIESRDGDILFVKPQTFMNESGRTVSWYQEDGEVKPQNFVVLYDDVDLPVGKMKISFDRSSGGHNGIKSIEQHLGSREFVRIRVGIAPLGEDGSAITPANRKSFVLKGFSEDALEAIKSLAPQVRKALIAIQEKGYAEAMNQFNTK